MTPPPQDLRTRRAPHPDTQRLKTLINLFEEGGNSDFEQYLFFAHKTKTSLSAYRKALDLYHQSHE